MQKTIFILIASIMAMINAGMAYAADADEYLSEMESPVYKADGKAGDILDRGTTCISQNTGTIDNRDNARDAVVSTIRYEYTRLLITYTVRGKLTLMAKDGRFRMKMQQIERMQNDTGGWGVPHFDRVKKIWGVGWEAMRDNIRKDIFDRIADCTKQPVAKSDW